MTSYAFESATPNENDDHDLCHLGTISKLQSKLEDAKLKSSKIEKENQTLHQEQEKLRNALSNVESRYNETKKSLFKMMDNVSSRERELNIVETRWRVLVDKERNEVESARKEYLNQVQQLQNMRSQIRQEVEKEYVEQVELLTKEKDEWEDKYHAMKRSHEVSIVKNKISIETMTKEVEAAKKMKFNEVTELQEVLTNHMEGTADSANQIDQLRMDIAEANVHIEQMTLSERELKKSLQEALDERNNAMLVKNEAISSYEIKLTGMNRSCVSKEAQLQALQNEVGHLKTTINTLNISLKQKSDELKHEWSKVSSLTSQLQEKDNCLQQQIEDLKLERHNASARIKSQLSALQQENISLLRQKQTIEGYLTETRSEVKRMKTELSVKEQYAKRQIETNMNETILENSKLCFKVSELESERKQRDIDHHSKVQKLANDCEIYKHEASLAANESGTIAKKYVILEQAIDELKTKYQETQEELERTSGEVIAQQKKLESVEEKLCDEESEKNIMKMTSCKRIKDQQDAYIASTNEKERLQSELSLMKSKLEVERREMKEVMKGQEKMLKSQINKEKRKAECYKEKAIDAHTKNLHAKHLLRQQEQQRNDLRSP